MFTRTVTPRLEAGLFVFFTAVVAMKGNAASPPLPQGTAGNVWRQFWLSQWGGRGLCYLWVASERERNLDL